MLMRALSQQLGISPRTVTGLVDALEADGWVTRTPHPDDRRATIISITPTARPRWPGLQGHYEGLAHDLVGDVPAEDLQRCWSVITTLEGRLEEVVARRKARLRPAARPQPAGVSGRTRRSLSAGLSGERAVPPCRRSTARR